MVLAGLSYHSPSCIHSQPARTRSKGSDMGGIETADALTEGIKSFVALVGSFAAIGGIVGAWGDKLNQKAGGNTDANYAARCATATGALGAIVFAIVAGADIVCSAPAGAAIGLGALAALTFGSLIFLYCRVRKKLKAAGDQSRWHALTFDLRELRPENTPNGPPTDPDRDR